MPVRRVIRVFADWGHPWPLWGDIMVDDYALTPENLKLSAQLTDVLRRWYRFWEIHFDPVDGWDHDVNRILSRARGKVMIELLREELGGSFEVKDELHRSGDS